MTTRTAGPIHSLLVNDEDLAELDRFVVALGERIDTIQEADSQGRWDEVAKYAEELVHDATRMGLPPLAEAAERLTACALRGDPVRAHEEVVALTDVVLRVRLGHRGGVY